MLELMSVMALSLLAVLTFSIQREHRKNSNRSKHKEGKIPVKKSVKIKAKKEKIWLIQQGYFSKDNLSNVFSDDGGINWYVIDHGIAVDEPKKIALEDKHQQALLHPRQWEKLKKYVAQNGPIHLKDPKGVRLLRKAGFEVRTKMD